MGMVGLEKVTDAGEIKDLASYVQQHKDATGSAVAEELLKNWGSSVTHFVKVMPHDYKRVMLQQAKEDSSEGVDAVAA